LALPIGIARADDDHDNDGKFQVVPRVFDPADTDLVQSTWLSGTGCPTGARYAKATAANNFNPTKPTGTFTDPACPTGDPKDKENEGLLLVKTGPTDNNAAGIADIKGLPKNLVLTELGYDIRKPGVNQSDPRGSHCGAGALQHHDNDRLLLSRLQLTAADYRRPGHRLAAAALGRLGSSDGFCEQRGSYTGHWDAEAARDRL